MNQLGDVLSAFDVADLDLVRDVVRKLLRSRLRTAWGVIPEDEMIYEGLTSLWLVRDRSGRGKSGKVEAHDEECDRISAHLVEFAREAYGIRPSQAKGKKLRTPSGEDDVPFETWLFHLSGESSEPAPDEVRAVDAQIAQRVTLSDELINGLSQVLLYYSIRGRGSTVYAIRRWGYFRLWLWGTSPAEMVEICPWLRSRRRRPYGPLRTAFRQLAEALGEELMVQICDDISLGDLSSSLELVTALAKQERRTFAQLRGGICRLPSAQLLEYYRVYRVLNRDKVNQSKARYRSTYRRKLARKQRRQYQTMPETDRQALLVRIRGRIAEDPEGHRAKRMAYLRKNRKKLNKARTTWYEANKDRINADRRKKRKAQGGTNLTAEQKEKAAAASRRWYAKNRKEVLKKVKGRDRTEHNRKRREKRTKEREERENESK